VNESHSFANKVRQQVLLNFSVWSKKLLFLSTFCKVRKRNIVPQLVSEYNENDEICCAANHIVNEAVFSKLFEMSFPTRSLVGMSGQRFRKLLNKLIGDLHITKYLEVGTFRGSTAIAGLIYNDECRGLLIDNFSQFGAQKEKLMSNLDRFKVSSRVNLIDNDFRYCIEEMKNFSPQVFFFDGPHDNASHTMAAKLLGELTLNTDVLFIVDDWNWTSVRESTWNGIANSKVKVKGSWEILSNPRDRGGQFGNWHNGSLIAILSSKDKP